MKLKVIEHTDGRLSFATEEVNVIVNKTLPKDIHTFEMPEDNIRDVFKESKKYKLKTEKGEKVLKKE